MSTNIRLRCPCDCENCDYTFFEVNYTHNVNKMMRCATGTSPYQWRDSFENKEAQYFEPILKELIDVLQANPSYFRDMNPKNGWGDYDRMLSHYLIPLLQACNLIPHAILHFSV